MSKILKLKRKEIFLGILSFFLGLAIYGGLSGLSENLVILLLPKENVLAKTSLKVNSEEKSPESNLLTIQENSLLPVVNSPYNEERVSKRIRVLVTAYSSSPQETDSTPYITASGAFVREGIVANNLLPFGTKLKIPEIFGNRVFVVEDRLNPKKGYYHVDVWFPSREKALNFGKKWTYIEVL